MLLFPFAVLRLCWSTVLSGYCNVLFYFLGILGVMEVHHFAIIFSVVHSGQLSENYNIQGPLFSRKLTAKFVLCNSIIKSSSNNLP